MPRNNISMMAEKWLTVKGFLEKVDKTSEIRRFRVPANYPLNYRCLKSTILENYPSLKQGNFILQWRDPDEDLITFSTDHQLAEALQFVKEGLFIITIKEVNEEEEGNVNHECESIVSSPATDYQQRPLGILESPGQKPSGLGQVLTGNWSHTLPPSSHQPLESLAQPQFDLQAQSQIQHSSLPYYPDNRFIQFQMNPSSGQVRLCAPNQTNMYVNIMQPHNQVQQQYNWMHNM